MKTAPVANNRRIDRRLTPKGFTKATCRKGTLDLGPSIAIGILDVAETGVRLTVREWLDRGEEVTVSLESPNHHRPLRNVGQVAWCVETTSHNYCVGIQFKKRISFGDLAKLT